MLFLQVCIGCGERTPLDQAAVAEIEKLGGKVMYDPEDPTKPIIAVSFRNCEKLTDDDLWILKGLTRLEYLDLSLTGVTDSALSQIKEFKQMEELNLYGTKITDAGLEHLKEMEQLKFVVLRWTRTTEEGRDKLMEALPDCGMSY